MIYTKCVEKCRQRTSTILHIAVLLVLGASACNWPNSRGEEVNAPSSGTAIALLADNELLRYSLQNGAILGSARLGPNPEDVRGVAHVMAFDRQLNSLVVLVTVDGPGQNQIAFIDPGTLRVTALRSVAVPEVPYRGLAVGPRSGRIYLFGDRSVGPDMGPTRGPPSDAAITVMNPQASAIISNMTVKVSYGLDWRVYNGALSDQEDRIYLSYHGPDTTGIDEFTLAGVRVCASSQDPSVACISGHGGFQFFHGSILVATGGPEIRLINPAGKIERTFNTKLNSDHLMEFGVSTVFNRLYAVGSCGYTPGMASIDLNGGHVFTPPAASGICGERVVSAGRLLIVQRLRVPVPHTSEPGALVLVDEKGGSILRRIPTPSSPLDVLVLDDHNSGTSLRG